MKQLAIPINTAIKGMIMKMIQIEFTHSIELFLGTNDLKKQLGGINVLLYHFFVTAPSGLFSNTEEA